MKRLISATLALCLLGSSVAMAQDYRGDRYAPDHRAYSTNYRSEDHGHSSNPAVAIGAGLAALGLFAAITSNHDHYVAHERDQRGYHYDYRGYVNNQSYRYR
jgi:hypothetical protein